MVFDPRTVDTILLRLPNGGGLEPCRLTEADQRFAGKPWEEIQDLGLIQDEARDRCKTSDLQSRVDHQAQVDAIVGKAVTEATAANAGLTKAARHRGVRDNRKAERLKDWAEAVATPVPGNGNGNGSEGAATPVQLQKDYVPPPSPIEMLRKQRELHWRSDEQ